MKNPNTNAVLTLAEKCADVHPSGLLYAPMVVQLYDAWADAFTIAADGRYEIDTHLDSENRDTAFYDIDDFTIPAIAIHALTGADSDFEDPNDWVGHFFIMPCAPVKAWATGADTAV